MASLFWKISGSISKIMCPCWLKNRYYVFITFKMLEMECKFEDKKMYQGSVIHVSQFISVEVKKLLLKNLRCNFEKSSQSQGSGKMMIFV